MITFQANYLNSATIRRVNIYKPHTKKVSFVEINPNLSNDVLALNKAAVKWDTNGGEGFAYDICEAVNKGYKDRFFVLTTQLKDFDNLDYRQILSMAQVKSENNGEEFIEYLQVDPANSSNALNAEFSHIGTAMLNSLKNLFCRENISLDSVLSAINFYLKNGFVSMGTNPYGEKRMLWEHNTKSLH